MLGYAYDYFYGSEADQFSFYRIPKALFTDSHFSGVSAEAKILYGILLDRMSLSVRNNWVDEDNRVYIYFKQDDAADMLGCGRDKAIKLFAELDTTGIGLIERKRYGQGKPLRIYVKNFVVQNPGGSFPPPQIDMSEKPITQTSTNQENVESFQQMGFSDLDMSEKPTAERRKNRLPVVGNSDVLYRMNKTELNNTELRSSSSSATSVENTEDEEVENLKEQIEYDYFSEELPDKLPFVDTVIQILTAIVHAHDESYHDLLAKIDSCIVLEFLDVVRGLDFSGVRNFTAYLHTVFFDFFAKREVELALAG